MFESICIVNVWHVLFGVVLFIFSSLLFSSDICIVVSTIFCRLDASSVRGFPYGRRICWRAVKGPSFGRSKTPPSHLKPYPIDTCHLIKAPESAGHTSTIRTRPQPRPNPLSANHATTRGGLFRSATEAMARSITRRHVARGDWGAATARRRTLRDRAHAGCCASQVQCSTP